MPPLPDSFLALVGPGEDRPCGIRDYVRRLEAAFAGRCRMRRVDYAEALSGPGMDPCRALLVHYERSLVPGPGYLSALAARHPGKVFVVPHEVYAEDPFAFPYSALRSAFPPLLWLKRLRYRWRHREYARELGLQRRAYHAQGVLPLTPEAAGILRGLASDPSAAARILDPVPHARFDPPAPAGAPAPGPLFPDRPPAVAGIFGFLNPGIDYGTAFDMVAALEGRLGLALLGGDRAGYPRRESLEREILRRALAERVRIAGWIPEDEVPSRLAECDLFLCPMRFKSSSGSLLQLFALGKPILAPELPLTRFLRDEGAPLHLYRGPGELLDLAREAAAGRLRAPADRYRWDMAAVAESYLQAMRAAGPALSRPAPAA